MDSITSLKKHMDNWSEAPPDDSALQACRIILLAAGRSGHRAVPDLGPNLERTLSGLSGSLSPPVSPEVLAKASQTAKIELSQWAEQAFLRHEASERDLKKIVDVMAKAIESVTERDARHLLKVGDLAQNLRSIAGMGDLAVISRSILENASALTACVERIVEEGRRSLVRLSAEVEDYRSRLVKSERLSSLDPLTGLANRRCFEEQLDVKIRAAKNFCLILIDLNNFKGVNDRLGHLAGDQVLKDFAGKLQLQFPSADLVARWGGDEFAVIITCSHKDAQARVHRIRRSALGQSRVSVARQVVTVAVDASIGVVEWDGKEKGPEMLARADRCMYQGKAALPAARTG
jgi:diguanylate cyclase (GGDEF)-like protein